MFIKKFALVLFMFATISTISTTKAFADRGLGLFASVGYGGSGFVQEAGDSGFQNCVVADVGWIFFSPIGFSVGYIGCEGDRTTVNVGKLQLLIQSKSNAASIGFKPFFAIGANYTTLSTDYHAYKFETDGFGVSATAGIKFNVSFFTMSAELAADYSPLDKFGGGTSDTVLLSGALKIGVAF